jgi:hypothetical protein
MFVSLVNRWAQKNLNTYVFRYCIVGHEDGADPVPETCVSAFRSVRKIAKSDY